MPFKSEKEVADKVKGTDKLSERKRRQFMHVVNKCIEEKGDDSSCYKQGWGAVNNTASMKVASELLKIAREIEFDYSRMSKKMWREKVNEAQERQNIHFDLENDDCEGDVKEVKIEGRLIGGESKPYRFHIQLCMAGGDWENSIYYWKVQLVDGLLRFDSFANPYEDNCLVFIPVDGNNNLKKGLKGALVATQDGEGEKFEKPDEKALKRDLIAFLTKVVEEDQKLEGDEKITIEFSNGRVASELLKIAKGLIGGEVPDWVALDWFMSKGELDLSGTPLKKFTASLHGIRTWALQAQGKVYRDQFGWISMSWVISPVLDGSEWKVKSEISFAPATSGSFAIRKFAEFKDLALVSGDDDFRMFNAFGKSLSIVPRGNEATEEINGLIKTHGHGLNEAKKFWKKQVKNFDLEGGR